MGVLDDRYELARERVEAGLARLEQHGYSIDDIRDAVINSPEPFEMEASCGCVLAAVFYDEAKAQIKIPYFYGLGQITDPLNRANEHVGASLGFDADVYCDWQMLQEVWTEVLDLP